MSRTTGDRGEATDSYLNGLSYNASLYSGGGVGITGNGDGDFSIDTGVGVGGHGASINYSAPITPNGRDQFWADTNRSTGGLLFGDNPFENDPTPGIIKPTPCGGCIFIPGNNYPVPVPGPKDPNGKITSGFGDQGYVPPNTAITYTIYFENQSSATAPAEIVTVTDPLPSNLDWSTVQLNQIQFNNVTTSVPASQQSYVGQVSVSTSPYPVSVNASLNPSSGVLTWSMQSVNPATGGLPADPMAGFLPPNNASNQGTGYVTFSVKPKTGLANGTSITNQASIVFDVNAAIGTNTVTNTIDSVYPTSSVSSLPAVTATTSFTVSWSGSDPAGAGIASYNIFVSVNSGPYSLWLAATTATSATYSGASNGNTYSFYSMATDNVGHTQQSAGPVQTTTVGMATLQSIAVTPANSSAGVGMTQQFMATGIYSDKSTQNLTAQVTWSSGTPGTAAISTGGLVTARTTGSSTIGAALGAVSGSTLLTVMTFSPCDLNQNKLYDVADVQAIVNQALGASQPANDMNGDHAVNVADVQIVIDAVLGLGCIAP
jgi:hypothetical protein